MSRRGTAPSSLRRTSANSRPDEILMCSTAIVRDVTEILVIVASQRFYLAQDFWIALAALRITSSTRFGRDSIGTWLLSVSTVVAFMRFAAARSRSG